MEAILEAAGAAGTTLALRDRALLEVLYGTGARISEAVGLDVDDLDQVDGTVLLRGKGGKERLVPVGSYAREAVDAYLVRGRPELVADRPPRTGGALFLNARGGRLSRQSAWAVLVKAAERAGVTRDVSPAHAAALLRHPPARRRRRRARRAGAARARLGDHHAGLHAGHRRQPARGLRDRAPPGPGVSGSSPTAGGARVPGGADADGVYDAFTGWVDGAGAGALPAPGRGGPRAARPATTSSWRRRPGRGSRWWRSAAHVAALADDRVSFYTAPIKALVSEKFFALCEVFGADERRHAHRRRLGERRRPDHLLHRRGAGQHRAARGRRAPTSGWW